MASLLSVENLQVQFQTKKGINTAVDGVSFSVEKGRILGIVGESGCGKSVTSMSILQLLGSNARISGGSIKLDGKELIGLPEKEMCRIRGNDIAMIFQDPMTALNPTLTIGTQLMEPIMLHQNCGKKRSLDKSCGRSEKSWDRCSGEADEGISASAFWRYAPASDDRHGSILRAKTSYCR